MVSFQFVSIRSSTRKAEHMKPFRLCEKKSEWERTRERERVCVLERERGREVGVGGERERRREEKIGKEGNRQPLPNHSSGTLLFRIPGRYKRRGCCLSQARNWERRGRLAVSVVKKRALGTTASPSVSLYVRVRRSRLSGKVVQIFVCLMVRVWVTRLGLLTTVD